MRSPTLRDRYDIRRPERRGLAAAASLRPKRETQFDLQYPDPVGSAPTPLLERGLQYWKTGDHRSRAGLLRRRAPSLRQHGLNAALPANLQAADLQRLVTARMHPETPAAAYREGPGQFASALPGVLRDVPASLRALGENHKDWDFDN